MEEITKHMLKIDPEFKNLIPPLLPDERAGLEKSLLEEGCRDSIVVWNETIIDGHNRYEICNKHFIDFGIVDMKFDNRDDVIEWIYQNQLSRRNLIDVQRAYLIGKQYEHRKNRHGGTGNNQYKKVVNDHNDQLPKNDTVEKIAIENNVSRESVKRAEQFSKAVDKVAKNLGDETKKKILSGELKTNKKDVIELSNFEPEKQKAIVDGVLSGKFRDTKKAISSFELQQSKKEIEQAAQDNNAELHIEHGDCIEWLKRLNADADLLITDPPYATDVDNIEEFAQSWLPHALARVKSTGRAYVCIGAYPDELKAYLNVEPGHLELCQVLVWTYRNTLGPSPKEKYKQNWQAILYYKGADAPDLNCPIMVEQFSVQDINAPDNRHGHYERWHAWQKPDELAERLIRHSTNAGDLVIDPFAGTGTFLIAAAKLGREAIGCDNDHEMIKISQSRAGALA